MENYLEIALDTVTERPRWQSDVEFYRWRCAASDPIFAGVPKESYNPVHRRIGHQGGAGGNAPVHGAWGIEHHHGPGDLQTLKAAKHAKQMRKQKAQAAVAVVIIILLTIGVAAVTMMPYEQRGKVLQWIVFAVSIMLGVVLFLTCVPAVKQVGQKYNPRKMELGKFDEG